MDRKFGEGLCPFGEGGAGSPSNTMWPGPRPTCKPSFILIRPTVWPQCTNVADRQDNGPIAYRRTVLQNGRPKTLPPPLADITRESLLKILGVAFSNNLSASYHIRRIVSESAQTLYALPVLQHHGLSDVGLHQDTRGLRVPGNRSVELLSRLNYT